MRMMHMGLHVAALAMSMVTRAADVAALGDLGTVHVNRRSRISSKHAMRSRSKKPPTKRKLKANRLHISRRTKRKHRRAAR